MERRAHRELRRAVPVIQPCGRLLHRSELLTAEHDVFYREVILVQECQTKGGAHRHTRDTVGCHIACHAVHVLTQILVQKMHLGSCSQRVEQVEGGGIEREAGKMDVALGRTQAELRHVPLHTGTDGPVRQHTSLRLARRARGVYHISQRVGGSPVDGRAVLGTGIVSKPVLRDDHLGFCIVNHILTTVLRIFRINGNVCRTGLLDTDDTGEELLPTRKHDGDKVILAYALSYEPVGDDVRLFVELSVCVCATPALHRGFDDGQMVRSLLHTLQEYIDKGLRLIVADIIALAHGEQTHRAGFVHQIEVADHAVRMVGYGTYRLRERLQHGFDLSPAVDAVVKADTDVQALIVKEHLDGEVADIVLYGKVVAFLDMELV